MQLHCIVYSVLVTPFDKSSKNTISYYSVYVYVLLDMGLEMTNIQLFYI